MSHSPTLRTSPDAYPTSLAERYRQPTISVMRLRTTETELRMDESENRDENHSNGDVRLLSAWVVPLEPLKFVLSSVLDRDEDPWRYTLAQIMDGGYDQHLLARISASLPSIHPNLPVFISFGGVVALARSQYLPTRVDAAHEFNRIIGHLVLGGVFFHAVRPGDVMRGFVGVEGWITVIDGSSRAGLRERNWEVPPLVASSLHFAGRVRDIDLHWAHMLGAEVEAALNGFPVHVLSTALTSLWHEDFESALLSFWTCIEYILHRAWRTEFLAAQFKHHPAIERRLGLDRLGAGEMIEMLGSAGRIEKPQLTSLNEVRKARNDLAHTSRRPEAKVVKRSAKLFFDLASIHVRPEAAARWSTLLNEIFAHLNPPPRPAGPQPVVDDGRWIGPLDHRELIVSPPKYSFDPRHAARLASEVARKPQTGTASDPHQE